MTVPLLSSFPTPVYLSTEVGVCVCVCVCGECVGE